MKILKFLRSYFNFFYYLRFLLGEIFVFWCLGGKKNNKKFATNTLKRQVSPKFIQVLTLIIFPVVFITGCKEKNTKIDDPGIIIINVDLSHVKGPMSPVWAWFGYDEPNYTYMKDGKKLLSEIAELSPVPVYVRTHNLLSSGDGTPALKWGSSNAYTEDK